MSDYLISLITRSYGSSHGFIKPRPRSLFEPPILSDGAVNEIQSRSERPPDLADNSLFEGDAIQLGEQNRNHRATRNVIETGRSNIPLDVDENAILQDIVPIKTAQVVEGQTREERSGISLRFDPISSSSNNVTKTAVSHLSPGSVCKPLESSSDQVNHSSIMNDDNSLNEIGRNSLGSDLGFQDNQKVDETSAKDLHGNIGTIKHADVDENFPPKNTDDRSDSAENGENAVSKDPLGAYEDFRDNSKRSLHKHFVVSPAPNKADIGVGLPDSKSIRPSGNITAITPSKPDLSKRSDLEITSDGPSNSYSQDVTKISSNIGSENNNYNIIARNPPIQKGTLPRSDQKFEHRSPMERASRKAADSEPEIHVTIGRVEVRAIMPPPPVQTKAVQSPPVLSLDDYLKRLNGDRL